jgi:hypothetical protein
MPARAAFAPALLLAAFLSLKQLCRNGFLAVRADDSQLKNRS